MGLSANIVGAALLARSRSLIGDYLDWGISRVFGIAFAFAESIFMASAFITIRYPVSLH